jgi:hypothetical protein
MNAEKEDVVMVINKPHFKVTLHPTRIEVDLKTGIRKQLEDFLESRPAVRESIGLLFQNIIPLDVALKDIDSVKVNKNGVKLVLPMRKDIVIPLKSKDADRLVDKLNELISVEKEKVVEQMKESEAASVGTPTKQAAGYEAMRRREVA